MNIVAIKPAPNNNLVEELQILVEKVKSGEIDNMVCAFATRDDYCFLYNTNLEKALVLATLLHANCVDRFKA